MRYRHCTGRYRWHHRYPTSRECRDKTYVWGLDKCIQFDLKLGFMERERWILAKKEIKNLMPYGIFDTWPLNAKVTQYCANEVVHLLALR